MPQYFMLNVFMLNINGKLVLNLTVTHRMILFMNSTQYMTFSIVIKCKFINKNY